MPLYELCMTWFICPKRERRTNLSGSSCYTRPELRVVGPVTKQCKQNFGRYSARRIVWQRTCIVSDYAIYVSYYFFNYLILTFFRRPWNFVATLFCDSSPSTLHLMLPSPNFDLMSFWYRASQFNLTL